MITKRNGVWRLDVRLPDGSRIRKSLGTTDKAQANLLAPDALRDEIRRLQSDPAKEAEKRRSITLGAAFRRAMKEREEWRASKSPETLEGNFKLICAAIPETTDLATIDYSMMLTFAADLREHEVSPSTINQRLSLISVLIEMAATTWKLAIVPYKMPRMKITQGRIRTVSHAEEAQVLKHFAKGALSYHLDMCDLVPCLVDSGFRLSEMLNVNIEQDVDFESNTIQCWVNKADQPRIIPMTTRVREIMTKRADLVKPFGMLTIFSAAVCWQWVRKELRLSSDAEFVLHALRHTTASRLAAAGMDAFRIQKFMGHKSITTTQIYVNLFGKDLGDLAAALERRPSVPIIVPKAVPKLVVATNPGPHGYSSGTLTKWTHNPLVPCSTHGRPTRFST